MFIDMPQDFKSVVERLGFEYTFYSKRKWNYVKITGVNSITESGWTRRIKQYYPAARLIRRTDTELTYNIGTVFDLIANPTPVLDFSMNIFRSVMPTVIASQIVGVQPMITASRPSGSLTVKQDGDE
jgi:hypothetical protein